MLMDHRATQNWKCHSNLDRLIMAVWGADPDPCWHWGHFLLSRDANFTSGKMWCFKATLLHHAAWYIPRVLFWGAPLCVKIRQVSRWHLNSRLDINGNKPHWHRVCVFSEKEKEFHINIACAWSGLQVLLCRLLLSSTATFFYSNPALVWGLCGSSSISLRFCVVHSDCWRHWSIFLNNIDSDNDNLCSVHRKKKALSLFSKPDSSPSARPSGCEHSRFRRNTNRPNAATPVFQLSDFLPSNKPPRNVTGRKRRKSFPTLSCHVWTAACDILHNRQDPPALPPLPPPFLTVSAAVMKGRLTCI